MQRRKVAIQNCSLKAVNEQPFCEEKPFTLSNDKNQAAYLCLSMLLLLRSGRESSLHRIKQRVILSKFIKFLVM